MSHPSLPPFATLGEMLKYLRRRAHLTQRELSIAVGFSESQISRLEQNERTVDRATLLARFVPALDIEEQPEVVNQLLELAAGRKVEKPPLDNLPLDDLPPTNLPQRLTSFVGRKDAIHGLQRILLSTRLVTLTGVGGVGKTSLAQIVGAEMLSDFFDGVWWVDLAPLNEAKLVPQAFASIFKLLESSERTYLEALTTYCRDRHLLLIVDNCEHVVDAVAELADSLLRTCPRLHIMATSREALRVDTEVEWPVPPLSVPRLDAEADALAIDNDLQLSEAVHLFVERAYSLTPISTLSRQTVGKIAQVCAQLDGLPLAIELAASRLKGMTVSELAARLDNRFQLLTGGTRLALPRHRTLRAAVDWSYELLSAPDRALLRRLSVFAGGWTLEATEAIADTQSYGAASIQSPIEALLQLVNRSLVIAETHGVETRYRMLETIRQYASEKLQETDEMEAVQARHFTWFLALAEQSRNVSLVGRRLVAWLQRIELELDNLRIALVWSQKQTGSGQSQRLAGALWLFWFHRGRFREGRAWLEEALADDALAPLSARATALSALSILTFGSSAARRAALAIEGLALCRKVDDRLGMACCYLALGQVAAVRLDFPRAVDYYQQGLELCRAMNWLLGIAYALSFLADVEAQAGRSAVAIPLYEECFAFAQEVEETFFLANSLGCLIQLDRARGIALYRQELARQRKLDDPATLAAVLEEFGRFAMNPGKPEDLEECHSALKESLALWHKLEIKWSLEGGTARASMDMGNVHYIRGDYMLALEYEQEAVRLYQEVGDPHGVAWAQMFVGWPALALGNLDLAFTSFRASLKPSDYGSMNCAPQALVGLAETVRQQGDLVRAARLFGAAVRFEYAISPKDPKLEMLPAMQTAHTYLDNPTFAAAWAEGEAMTIEEVIAYALE